MIISCIQEGYSTQWMTGNDGYRSKMKQVQTTIGGIYLDNRSSSTVEGLFRNTSVSDWCGAEPEPEPEPEPERSARYGMDALAYVLVALWR